MSKKEIYIEIDGRPKYLVETFESDKLEDGLNMMAIDGYKIDKILVELKSGRVLVIFISMLG